MAASSQFHRRAVATANPHYRPLPGDPEHMYANLATTWNSPHGPSQASIQRPFAGHYLDYAGPSDYVNNPPSSQSTWPANHTRPAAHSWVNSFNPLHVGNHTARLLPYVVPEARAPVPHTIPSECHPQHSTDVAQMVPFNAPEPLYRLSVHQHEYQQPPVCEIPAS
jgi:hypothetical protein